MIPSNIKIKISALRRIFAALGTKGLSILYRLFFETQGRKHGRILSWS